MKIDDTNKNTIVLITTKGCEGCSIARRNIKEAISATNKNVVFREVDLRDVEKSFLVKQRIRDFPTILIYNRSTLRFKSTGSGPVIFYLRYFDLYCL